MTPAEAVDVLSKCAAFDQRTVGQIDVIAWHEIIGHLALVDCLEAVTTYYREQSTRAMPADIRKLAIGIRDARQAREHQAERRAAIESGPTVRDRSADVTALVRTIADALPKPDVHEKAKARARKERGQPKPAPPKKRRKPPKDYPAPMTADVANLATRYLIDGHAPTAVAERLAISRRWCERTAQRFTRRADQLAAPDPTADTA